MNNFKKIFAFLIIASAFVFYFGFYNPVHSDALDNVSGYAWGGDAPSGTLSELGGMGWLSFNCITGGNCGSSNYGVDIDTAGNISGFAWSANYGWLKFGGLSGFPAGAGTTASDAKLTGSTVTGWARFCSVAANPALCAGATVPNTFNGGWDGWVSLSGTGYGITQSGATLSGYAWGGPDVVGWINFSNVSFNPLPGAVTITANGQTGTVSVVSGAPVTLDWITQNMVACSAFSPDDSINWVGAKNIPSGPEPSFILTAVGIKTYTLDCVDSSNTSYTDTVLVNVTPAPAVTLNFYPDSYTVFPPNYQTNLHWSSNIALSGCVADSSSNISSVPSWTGAVAPTPAIQAVTAPYNPTRYDLSCFDGPTQIFAQPVFVSQGDLPESVALSSNGVALGQTTLSWATVNVGSCIASSSNGAWSGSKANNGLDSGVSVTAIAPGLDTFSLTCDSLYNPPNKPTATIQLNTTSKATTNKIQPKYKER